MFDVTRVIESKLGDAVYVSKRPPNDDDILKIVESIFDTASELWHDDRREWTDFGALVGFQIAIAQAYYRFTGPQYNHLVALCMLQLPHERRMLGELYLAESKPSVGIDGDWR